MYKLQTEIEKLVTERRQLESRCVALSDNIKNEFKGSTEQLEETLTQFEAKLEHHKVSLLKVTDIYIYIIFFNIMLYTVLFLI